MLIIIGLLIGLLIGLFVSVPLPAGTVPYLAVFTMVGLASLTSAYRQMTADGFSTGRFLFEFVVNTVISMLLIALGNQMKFDLALVVAFVFAYRVFRDVTILSRRFYASWQARRRRRAEEQPTEPTAEKRLPWRR